MTESYPEVIADAGPIIHLDELNCLDSLRDFSSVRVPETVEKEIITHRNIKLSEHVISVCPDPPVDPLMLSMAKTLCLHKGELMALSEAKLVGKNVIFLTDDSAARTAASQMGIRVHGTLGVLLRSVRLGRKSKKEVTDILSDFHRKSSLHIRTSLIQEVIDAVNRFH